MTVRNVGSTYNFTYDYENHLTGVTGAVTNSDTYNGDGQRVKEVSYESHDIRRTRFDGYLPALQDFLAGIYHP